MMRAGWGLAVLVAAWPALALAQEAQVPFGGLKHDSSKPVEITSDRLDVDQTTGTALFTGTVKVAQDTLRLAADKVQVFYAEVANSSTGRISRLVANGNVTLTNGAEAAEGASADYDVVAGTITMEGDVLLTQAQNALSGQKLLIDLNKGTAQMQGRVQTIFVPNTPPAGQAGGGAKPPAAGGGKAP
jgi:lipopolysaccharide export system protein LptA